MATIKINKSEIKRLEAFASFVKSASTMAEFSEKHAFVLDEKLKKLEVYAEAAPCSGAYGLVEIRLDLVEATATNLVYFILSSAAFAGAANKVSGDVVTISVDERRENRLTFAGSDRSRVSLSPNVQRDWDEIKEMTTRIEKVKNHMKDKVVVPANHPMLADLLKLSAMAKALDHIGDVEVTADAVKAADELCIVSISRQTGLKDTMYINRDFIQIMKDAGDVVFFGNDYRQAIFDVPNKGISAYVQFGSIEYDFPTDDELRSFLPDDSDFVTIEVATADLFKTLVAFDGIFDNASWRFKQVRIKFDRAEITKTGEGEVFYDDLKAECHQYLKMKVLEDKSALASFSFVLSTTHLTGALKSLLEENDNLILRINGLGSSAAKHNRGILLETSRARIILPKMME